MTDAVIGSGPVRDVHRHRWSCATKVTWLGHRAGLLGLGLVFFAAAALVVVPGVKVNSAYGWYLVHHCVGSATSACQMHLQKVKSEHTWAYMVGLLLLLVPWIAGVFVGAPLVANELETGTFRFTWTQGSGRIRFELSRLVVLGVVVVACACVLGLLMGWFIHPLEALRDNSRWDARLFNSTVLILPAWSLLSFGLGTLLGAIIRRTVPAMATTAVLAGALLLFVGKPAEGKAGSLTTMILDVFPAVARSRSWIGTAFFNGPSTGQPFAPRGSWVVRTFTKTPRGKPLPNVFGTKIWATLWTNIVHRSKGQTPGRLLADHHFTFWYSFQPAARYWTFEIVFACIAIIVGVLVVFGTLRLVRRIG